MKLLTNKHGFTLIELLVVITIIGLLGGIGITSFIGSQKRGRDGRRQTDLSSLRDALELFYSEKGEYINTSDSWEAVSTLGAFAPDFAPDYIKVLPSDPGGGGVGYYYRSVSSAQGYCLSTKLETASGTQSTCTVDPTAACSGCNYGVGNP